MTLELENEYGAASVETTGARVVSWVLRGGEEVFFMPPHPDDWRHFVCVEPATIPAADALTIRPGERQAHADAISMWDYQITYGTTACVCYPTPAGRVLRSDLGKLPAKFCKGYELDKWDWPFKYAIWPTMKGTVRGQVLETPAEAPEGYAWYKVAENVQLKHDSVIGLVCGSFFPLTGVVSDNSELGQEYDIYASVKVEGPDVFKTGKATRKNVFSVDQLAVVRKTKNGEAK